MFTNNQIPAFTLDECSIQAQDCDIRPITPSTKYTPEALEVFAYCLYYIHHFVAMDLHRLQKLYPCTIADIDLRYLIQFWADMVYFNFGGYCPDTANVLLDSLGLPQIDEKVYAELEYHDQDAAEDLLYQSLDNAVEYIQSGIYENWQSLLCDYEYYESAVCQWRRHSSPREWFAFSNDFSKPEQYSSLARKLLYDCFCYMYDNITELPEKFLDASAMEGMVLFWLKRTYCDHKDARSVFKMLCLLGDILGVEVILPAHGFPEDFWKYDERQYHLPFMCYARKIAKYMGNCLMDLWDDFVEEYFNEDFQTMSLIDFTPSEG